MTRPPPIPEGYGTVTPWVVTKDTRRLLEFIEDAFDAEELARVEVEGGAIRHAEARIGDSVIMIVRPSRWPHRACCGCMSRTATPPSAGRWPPAPPR